VHDFCPIDGAGQPFVFRRLQLPEPRSAASKSAAKRAPDWQTPCGIGTQSIFSLMQFFAERSCGQTSRFTPGVRA
jgi:hypothetical protein